jgi:pyruvyltransferase
MKVFIKNPFDFHYEIIETVIIKYNQIFTKIENVKEVSIFVEIKENLFFKKYIKNKYPYVKFKIPDDYDVCISCTIYDKDYNELHKNSNKYFYISHDISDRLMKLSNVFFLTPLAKSNYFIPDKLPYAKKKIKTNVPIYVVQGNITNKRRNYDLLQKILDHKFDYEFKIKLVGRGNLPEQLCKYSDKIILKNNLNFIDYHKEFLDAYCMIPLVTKKTHPQYYCNKLTSTISYCVGYNLKCIIDKDLQDIYNLNDVEIFNDNDDIINAFETTLSDYYKNVPLLNSNQTNFKQKINVIYYKHKSLNGNFGDEISKVIMENMVNKQKYDLVFNQQDHYTNIVCVGSYIHMAKNNSYIFGSGVRTEDNLERGHKYKNLNVVAVRGPLTKKFLEKRNIKVGNLFGDPALLLPRFYKPTIITELSDKIGVIPHISNINHYNNIDSSMYLINPENEWFDVINKICSCKAIISSSLHGLICSDAYQIPNVWLDEYRLPEGDFKFKDYFASQHRKYIKIETLKDFCKELLYVEGNQLDLEILFNSFPFK